MSVRDEIVDARFADGLKYGLIYTEVLGWVDLGHAQGSDIKELISKMNIGELSNNGDECYDVIYSQGMIGMKKKVSISRFVKWRIRKGRTLHERYSIALAMMLTIARRFESMQGSFPFNLVTDSGFSGEDLVSDLLGFYRATTHPNPFELLRPVSKEEALKRWDYYGPIGSYKNESFRPLLFPDPEKFRNSKPYFGQLPSFMQAITPYNDFKSGNVGVATLDGVKMDIKSFWR
ncbi:Uncharacterised protein [Serratia fonticola]|nr:Uncharacterised protein [Serratia fonticola]